SSRMLNLQAGAFWLRQKAPACKFNILLLAKFKHPAVSVRMFCFRDNELLWISAFTCLLKIVEELSLFISPYLEKILVQASLTWNNWEHFKQFRPTVEQRMTLMQNHLAKLPLRTLLPCISRTYQQLHLEHVVRRIHQI